MSTPPEELSQKNTLTEGQIFEGRFQIISVLGQGGVGVVYKAKQTHMNKLVAIKTLMLSVVSGDAASFERFEQEAQAASSLAHPNIITIFDFGKSSTGLAYLVMEYLGGKNLDDVLEAEQRLDLDRFLRVAVQICDGLQHAHKKGVVHRDIKPTNIMLIDTEDAADTVKIVDFGLAKLTAVESEKHLTQTGTIVGTPLYMSPEQCRGLELDHRSDIYSLGCVFYTALTGKEPIHGATALDTLYKHTAQAPTPFNEACPGLNLPPKLEQVILKSLEKDPDLRQQSMVELRNDIRDAIYYRSFHSGMTTNLAGGGEAVQAAENPTRESGLSRTFDMSDSRLPAPPSPEKKEAEQTPQGEQSRVRRPAQAEAKAAKRQTLRGSHPSKEDHLVISKRSLMVAGAAGATLLAGLAFYFSAKNTNTASTPAATMNSPASQSGRREVATATNTSHAPASVEHAGQPQAHQHEQKLASIAPAQSSLIEGKGRHPLKNAIQNPQLLKQANDFEKLAKDQAVDHQWPLAESNFRRSLQLQMQVYDSHDHHLFPILAHLVACQNAQHNEAGATKNLRWALEIFDRSRKLVMTEVSRRKDQIIVWRALARTSHTVAVSTRDNNYLIWSADFYELARNACILPDQAKEYRTLSIEYCVVLDQIGKSAKASDIRQELHLPLGNTAAQQANNKGPWPGRQPGRSGPRIERHGTMSIWNRYNGR